ncbi:MAG: ATP-dependent zinc metalloprotease FtsH [Spirochaetota bacterium]
MGDDQKKNGNNQDPFNFNFRNNRFALILLLAILGIFVLLLSSPTRNPGVEIDYSTFVDHVEQNRVESVTIIDQYEIRGRLRGMGGEDSIFRTRIPYFDDELMRLLREGNVPTRGQTGSVPTWQILLNLFPWVFGIFIIWFMFRQMQGSGNRAFSFGKSRAKKYADDGSKVVFADVAGQAEAKYELQEVVEFLKNPAKFTRMGAKIPKGVLLVGMPGTGKTLLAKACAGEAGVSFFHMSGSDFVEMFVGVGASRVRDLFEQGRKSAPCILFIDELDAVGRTRGAGYGGGHDEREQTLNQMLVEMDGFDTKDGVIILAATNRADVLDPALLRPGRFDRQVVVDMPDHGERAAILRIHASRIPLSPRVDLDRVARATPGCSGADIANLVNEAALYAARRNRELVQMDDFEEARDKIMMGVARRSRVFTEDEKRKTACHEAGHALLHYYLPNSDPLHKVTIVPRGRALGVSFSLPEKDTYSHGRGWLLDRIKIAYGGYVAEEMFYDETTTGTQADLAQATDIARKMVTEWGMSPLGPVAYGQEDQPIFLGKEIARHKDYSEEKARQIDDAIHQILDDAFAETKQILTEHRAELEKLTDALVDQETLIDREVRELLGLPERPDLTDLSDDGTGTEETSDE